MPSPRVRFANAGCLLRPQRQAHPTRVIDSHELILVQRGTLAMFEDESHFQVQPGEFLYLRPGRRHGGDGSYPEDLRFAWFHFHHRGPVPGLNSHGAFARRGVAADIASRLLDEQDRPDAPAGSCDLLMALLLLECSAARAPETGDPSGLAERARQLIVARHREALGPREIAAACGCTPDHLGRLFRARFGRSLGAALQAERIASAKALLREGGQTMAAVAAACGFADAHYFRRVFRRTVGTSPGEWRRLHQRMHVNAR